MGVAVLHRKSILVLDGLLAVVTLLLLAPRTTGIPVHEWLGIAVVFPVLLHLLFSWDWIRDTVRRLFTDGTARQRINFVLNALLFILIVIEVISGVLISHATLPALNIHVITDRSWRMLHNRFLGWLRLLVGAHLAMNWNWIVSNVRRWGALSHRVHDAGALAWSARFLMILAAAVGVSAVTYWWVGAPSLSRMYRIDEIANFAAGYRIRILQLLSQVIALTVVAYVARRWLRVRL